MKFKVDENLPIEIAQLLREAGHDVYSVHEQGLVGAKDRVLAEVCQSEKRAMVTLELILPTFARIHQKITLD